MGRSPDPLGKLPFPEAWRVIRDHHNDHWEVRLRPAVNLIGYFLFPVGWHWSEFKSVTPHDFAPYEDTTRNSSNQGILWNRPRLKPALTRWKTGRSYRRGEAMKYLERTLVREDLPCFPRSMRNLALPDRGERPITRSLNRADFSQINVDQSTVGRMISQQIDVTIDANDLISLLVSRNETRGAPRKHNALEIERWCRSHLERNTPILRNSENLKATLINAACDWQGEKNADPAGPDQVRPIVDMLLREYTAEE